MCLQLKRTRNQVSIAADLETAVPDLGCELCAGYINSAALSVDLCGDACLCYSNASCEKPKEVGGLMMGSPTFWTGLGRGQSSILEQVI